MSDRDPIPEWLVELHGGGNAPRLPAQFVPEGIGSSARSMITWVASLVR